MDRATVLQIAEQASAAGNTATAEAIRRKLAAEGGRTPRAGGSPSGAARLRGCHEAGVMTGTERRYAAWLDEQRAAGAVVAWWYECDRLKLADPIGGEQATRAKWKLIDFTVLHRGGAVSWDEIKGAWADKAARERFRWLAEKYPARWLRWWQWADGRWSLAMEGGSPKGDAES
jgi:hypothetical protein